MVSRGSPSTRNYDRWGSTGPSTSTRRGFSVYCGVGDLFAMRHHIYGKLQRKDWCIMVPKELVEEMDGFYGSPTRPARVGTKICCCVFENASELNDATDMKAIETRLGQMSLPRLQEISNMSHWAYTY